MRRHAGEYLREQLLDRVLGGGTLTLCGIGWLFGGLLSAAMDASLWLVMGPPVGFIAAGTWRLFRGWHLSGVGTGARTEEKATSIIWWRRRAVCGLWRPRAVFFRSRCADTLRRIGASSLTNVEAVLD